MQLASLILNFVLHCGGQLLYLELCSVFCTILFLLRLPPILNHSPILQNLKNMKVFVETSQAQLLIDIGSLDDDIIY